MAASTEVIRILFAQKLLTSSPHLAITPSSRRFATFLFLAPCKNTLNTMILRTRLINKTLRTNWLCEYITT